MRNSLDPGLRRGDEVVACLSVSPWSSSSTWWTCSSCGNSARLKVVRTRKASRVEDGPKILNYKGKAVTLEEMDEAIARGAKGEDREDRGQTTFSIDVLPCVAQRRDFDLHIREEEREKTWSVPDYSKQGLSVLAGSARRGKTPGMLAEEPGIVGCFSGPRDLSSRVGHYVKKSLRAGAYRG